MSNLNAGVNLARATWLHAVRAAPAATAGSCADFARPEIHCLESARPCRDALTARADCRQPADLGWTSVRSAGDVHGHRRYVAARSPRGAGLLRANAAWSPRGLSHSRRVQAAGARSCTAVRSLGDTPQQLGHRMDRGRPYWEWGLRNLNLYCMRPRGVARGRHAAAAAANRSAPAAHTPGRYLGTYEL